MSNLNLDNLRTILSEIFFAVDVRADNLKYIVPKQGNWYNPQDNTADMIATWIGYNIPDRRSIIRPRSVVVEDTVENVVNEIVTIDLQFIGTDAEAAALSVMHWNSRADVQEALAVVSGQPLDESVRVIQSIYKQEGFNTTYAYNVKRRIVCANTQSTVASLLQHVYIAGNVT